MALGTPERLSATERSFNPSPASSRRSIGISALSMCVGDSSLAPAQAVRDVLCRADISVGDSKGGAWWEEWYRRLPAGARAVVQAEATTWATQLHSALDWSRFEPPALLGRDYRWDCTRSPRVTLHGKVDVRVSSEDRPVLLVAPTGIPGPYWWAALALSALLAGLVRGAAAVPTRVRRNLASLGAGQNPSGRAWNARPSLEARGGSSLGDVEVQNIRSMRTPSS